MFCVILGFLFHLIFRAISLQWYSAIFIYSVAYICFFVLTHVCSLAFVTIPMYSSSSAPADGCVRSYCFSRCCCDLSCTCPDFLGNITRSEIDRLQSTWPETGHAKLLCEVAAASRAPTSNVSDICGFTFSEHLAISHFANSFLTMVKVSASQYLVYIGSLRNLIKLQIPSYCDPTSFLCQ